MVFEKIRELICLQFALDEDSVTPAMSFVDDLGADSLDVVELTMGMEEVFGLPEMSEDELKTILTVGDLVAYVERVMNA